MNFNAKERKQADKLIMGQLIRENKTIDLETFKDLLAKEKSNQLNQSEATTLYHYRYNILIK